MPHEPTLDPADDALVKVVHLSGNEIIGLHDELCDLGAFDRPQSESKGEHQIFSGFPARTGIRGTCVFLTPSEETQNDGLPRKPQALIVGLDARHLAIMMTYYYPAIAMKFQVMIIILLLHVTWLLDRHLRRQTYSYLYLAYMLRLGDIKPLWAPPISHNSRQTILPRTKCRMGNAASPLTWLRNLDMNNTTEYIDDTVTYKMMKENKPAYKKITSPGPVQLHHSKPLLSCCMLLLYISSISAQPVASSCNRVDGELLLCSKTEVRDELVESAELRIEPSYNEVTELLMICEKLRRHKVNGEMRKYNATVSVQNFGRLPARGCEHELRTQNATLPILDEDLIQFLQIEEIPKDSVWIQVEFGSFFPTPAPLSMAHRDVLGERWMETAGTKNQRIHFPDDFQKSQTEGSLMIKNMYTIRACLEQTLLQNTSFTHASLEIQPDKTVLCILVDCRKMNCTRLPSHQAAVLLLQETYLYGGLVGMPVTPNIEDGKLTASCLISTLNEFPLHLQRSDVQDLHLAVDLQKETINKCHLYVSTNPATGQAENRGHEHLCLGLRPTLEHIPVIEPCLAVRTLLGDPQVGQDQVRSGERIRRSFASIIMNLIRLTTAFGGRITQQAGRFIPGAASRAMQPLGLSYAPAVSRLSLDAVSLAGTEVVKKGFTETLKNLAANTVIQAIGIGAATTITSVTVPVVLEGVAAKLRELEARELREFVNNNYEHNLDAIRGLSNFSHVSWGIEGNLRLIGGPEILPSNHSGEPIRLLLPAPKSDLFDVLFPQTTTTSFKKINILTLRVWELLTFYVEVSEILVKAFRGDLLLPGLTKKLEKEEFWVISLLEDRAKQSKYRKNGIRVNMGEVQTDLNPVVDTQGRLRRLKTLEITGRFDPCRSYHSGYIAPFCWYYSSLPFVISVPLLGGQLVTVYNSEVSVACGDGTVHIGAGEYAVFTVPEECLIERGMDIGHPNHTSSRDDIKIYYRTDIKHLPLEHEVDRYRKPDPHPTPGDDMRSKTPLDHEQTTLFPTLVTTTALDLWLTIDYNYRVAIISCSSVFLALIAFLSLFSDVYSNLYSCLTMCVTEIIQCRRQRRTTLQQQRRQDNLIRLHEAMLPVAEDR